MNYDVTVSDNLFTQPGVPPDLNNSSSQWLRLHYFGSSPYATVDTMTAHISGTADWRDSGSWKPPVIEKIR